MRTRSATYPDRDTAQWATQRVVTANEQLIHRWLAQSTRAVEVVLKYKNGLHAPYVVYTSMPSLP
ncbi:hypothetical protein ABZ352_34900 [Streptomyces griseofuscus]